MTVAVSRAVMLVAECCLGESRREWALAMRAEFEVAAVEGRPFAFALGCLTAAWREMPNHAEGRLVLSNYALALGVLIPMAVLQFALALDVSSLFGGAELNGVVPAAASRMLLLAPSQFDAAPSLLALRLLIGAAHLRLAWVLLELDWARVAQAGALIGAAMASFFLFTGALGLDLTFLAVQAAAMAIEFAAVLAAARRHERLFAPDPSWLDC
jgi:hypothetical protein